MMLEASSDRAPDDVFQLAMLPKGVIDEEFQVGEILDRFPNCRVLSEGA